MEYTEFKHVMDKETTIKRIDNSGGKTWQDLLFSLHGFLVGMGYAFDGDAFTKEIINVFGPFGAKMLTIEQWNELYDEGYAEGVKDAKKKKRSKRGKK